MRQSAQRPRRGMLWAANGVSSVHTRLARSVEQHLDHSLQLRMEPSARGWRELPPGRPLCFDMRGNYDGYYVDYALRHLGGRCYVVRLLPDLTESGSAAWAGWRSNWHVEGVERFTLKAASWTFFWGLPGREEKIQLFRAEWHEPGAADAPQPHWNVDAKLASAGPPVGSQAWTPHSKEGGSHPPDATDGSRIGTLGRLHLAMGGWQNAALHPACWKCTLSGEDDLLAWATHTLAHALTEFQRL